MGLLRAPTVWVGVAVGAAMHRAAVLPIATSIPQLTAASIWASGWLSSRSSKSNSEASLRKRNREIKEISKCIRRWPVLCAASGMEWSGQRTAQGNGAGCKYRLAGRKIWELCISDLLANLHPNFKTQLLNHNPPRLQQLVPISGRG